MLRLKILSILGLDVRNAVNAGHLILILVVDYTGEVGSALNFSLLFSELFEPSSDELGILDRDIKFITQFLPLIVLNREHIKVVHYQRPKQCS